MEREGDGVKGRFRRAARHGHVLIAAPHLEVAHINGLSLYGYARGIHGPHGVIKHQTARINQYFSVEISRRPAVKTHGGVDGTAEIALTVNLPVDAGIHLIVNSLSMRFKHHFTFLGGECRGEEE